MMFLNPWTAGGAFRIAAWLFPVAPLLMAGLLPSHTAAQIRQEQPREANQRSFANSVILNGPQAQTMQRLRVVRKYSLPQIRTNPQVALGEARLDFTPMLRNPKALSNIAQRLHSLPQHVQVLEESSDVNEVDQGVVIHQVLSYRVLPGKCSDSAVLAQLASAGVGCFTRAPASERIAEFSDPRSPRYVADPAKRQAAIAAWQQKSAQQDADASQHIADLRKALADPARRAAIVAQVGATEASRIDSLNDTQLKEEVLNSATQRFEETAFVPRIESANYAHSGSPLRIAASAGEMAATQQLLRGGQSGSPSGFPKLLRIVPGTSYRNLGNSSTPAGDQVSDLDLGTYIYLTGFTLGHDYEWKWGESITVNWCIIGCSSTYSVDLYAGFNYGFGLRFPIQTHLRYHNVVHPNNSAEATLTADSEPIEGSVEDFASTGLESDQIFDGKELVAQVGAHAGFDYNLPVIGSGGTDFSAGVDFTDLLPNPYKGGRFQPPAPGKDDLDGQFVFDQVDLLGGLLDFGVLGAKVFPAVDVKLHSNKLDFTLNDEIVNRSIPVTASPQTVNVAVSSGSGHDSHFRFGNPVYNVGLKLTPGIDGRLFVDVAVWSDHWDLTMFFPQLEIDLPPHGADFSCHSGTTCAFDFQPEHQAAVTSGIDQQLASLGCRKQGNTMSCPTYRGFLACQNDLKSHPLGFQSCDPGMAIKQGEAADRTLTYQNKCQHNGGGIGNYLCPGEGGMLDLCNTMLNNGAVLSCGLLVPTSTDQILKRGGCTENAGPAGTYVCPSSMMGLCQLYAKNKVITACKQR